MATNDPNICITDPGKHLLGPGSGLTPQQQSLRSLMVQQGLDPMQLADPQKQAMLQRMMMEEHKPYKCPVIGCEKAYKNQNGLKYHKQHGHNTQQLHENGDGTFSIVNPDTQAPYPGTMGMEKEKPFKCEFCHKRYKNLNGLKYHKAHSPYCVPEMTNGIQQMVANMNMNMNLPGLVGNISHGLPSGLPGIGEDDQML
jgi:transcription factor SFP1